MRRLRDLLHVEMNSSSVPLHVGRCGVVRLVVVGARHAKLLCVHSVRCDSGRREHASRYAAQLAADRRNAILHAVPYPHCIYVHMHAGLFGDEYSAYCATTPRWLLL